MGDYIRWAPPYYGSDEQNALGTRSALYLSLNRGKRSVRLDLKTRPAGRPSCAWSSTTTSSSTASAPASSTGSGSATSGCARPTRGIVYCAITGYGQDGPYAQRAGHDMNYLGLVGLLGLTGAADGPPVQPAGQIADLGGGGLMAAVGVMAALHERRRSGEGQAVDVSMADGALSWLAMVAGRYFCDGEVPRRGEGQLSGGILCYLPYEAADGWVSCGALEPKFWAKFCAGVGRPDLVEAQFEPPGSRRRRGRRRLPFPQPRPVEGLQRRARLLHRADPRPRRGARLRAGPRARDGGRGRAAASSARCASSACR